MSGFSALMRHSIAWPHRLTSDLPITERRAGGDAQLLADDVDAADHFADRVLDLQARVHLDKKELAVLI